MLEHRRLPGQGREKNKPEFRQLNEQEYEDLLPAQKGEYIVLGLKQKNFIHPIEKELYENKETTKSVGGHTEKAWWHWQEDPGLTPQWTKEVHAPLKIVSPLKEKKMAEQEQEEITDRRDSQWTGRGF